RSGSAGPRPTPSTKTRSTRPMRASPREECSADGLYGSLQLDELGAAGFARHDPDGRGCDPEPLREGSDEFAVRLTFHRRCSEPDAQRVTVEPRDLGPRCTRLNADPDPDVGSAFFQPVRQGQASHHSCQETTGRTTMDPYRIQEPPMLSL